jgi:glycosyltransferase involved in cell wall biosynthesis
VAKEALVLGAGRVWDEAKNLMALQRVAPQLPWPVAIAGPAAAFDQDLRPRAQKSERHAASACVEAKILGQLAWAELAEWLLRASVYAAPARYEPFGLGALEAAQAGCALVLGDIPSLHEVWGNSALYVDPTDDAALAAAINRLIADDRLRASLAAKARRRAAAYTPEATARGYLDVYAGLPVGVGGSR